MFKYLYHCLHHLHVVESKRRYDSVKKAVKLLNQLDDCVLLQNIVESKLNNYKK